MDDIPIQKIQISGPTLASFLHRISSSPSDTDGLLFGHVTILTPSNLSDDNPTSSSSTTTTTLIATITSFFSSTTTSSFNIHSLPTFPLPAGDTLLGWFSSRRKTHLRPSLKESIFTSSLSSNPQFSFKVENFTLYPNLFMLFTTPFNDQLIHTHDYRAYQFMSQAKSFEPKTLDIVNIGPAFRGHYGNFIPHSRLPSLPCQVKGFEAMVVEEEEGGENLESLKRVSEDQKELDKSADGFEIGRLGRLMGSNAANYTAELEDLYSKMLAKMDGLARLVEKSSARVLEQENHNMKLRYKVAGLE